MYIALYKSLPSLLRSWRLNGPAVFEIGFYVVVYSHKILNA